MPVDLRSGIVRILHVDGTTAGTGFVVSAEGLIATCSHVVQDDASQQRGDPRPETVRIQFVVSADERDAHINSESWRARDEGDIAILQLSGGLPEGTQVLSLGPAANTVGHHFRTRGFPRANERAASGEVLGLVPVKPGQMVLQLRSQEVTRGYSGAPVWDEQTRQVVGMVSDIAGVDEYGRGRDTAFATPSEDLLTACPALVLSDSPELLDQDRGGTAVLTLSLSWLNAFHRQQAEVAGEKYRPDLNVDLPISEDLAALGLSQSIVEEYGSLRKQLRRAIRHSRLHEVADLETEELRLDNSEGMQAVAAHLEDHSFSQALPRFENLEAALGQLIPLINSLEVACFRRLSANEALDRWARGDREENDRLSSLIYDCQSIRRPASALLDWLQESRARSAKCRLYFLTGSAGSGKTHLFLDSVHNALSEDRPALVLHGAQFGGELWTSIYDQLGLEPLGRDVLLTAMNAVAEANGPESGRFVIMIDAINETPAEGYWERNLPVLRAAIAHWPNLALAVSCRDTYVEVVDPLNERDRFVAVDHPGFSGREIEAADKYFSHYGLEAPRIPLLAPEFTVPLFLRLYCESLADGGVAVGHEGRIEIFERYLSSKIDRVTRRVFPSVTGNLEVREKRRRVSRALDALLDRMAGADDEWLRLDDAESTVAIAIGGDGDRALAIIGAFENEGVLSQGPLYLFEEGDGIAIRVLFQAFSDFLLLKRRLDQCSDPLHDETFRAWLQETASWGILEAATVVLPELYGIELPDFLGFKESQLSWDPHDSEGAWRRNNRARHVFQSVANMLPYRSSASVTDRSIELLNVALRSEAISIDLHDLLYITAPQPDHRLNANGMYHYLARHSMPLRDASFGFRVYHSLSEETSPMARLARWAAQGPYPSYQHDVIELSAGALIWLLSSPNRYMRDWVTKALVQLLHGHLTVVRSLIEHFWPINDPYLVQRVILIAFGSVMRGGVADPESAREIAVWVRDNVFARPARPDELMLNAARGILEWAVAHECLPISDLAVTERPYGLKIPGNPLSQERIRTHYEIDKDLPDERSYRTLYYSLFGIGDFGRYTVGSSLDPFSRYRHGQIIPEPTEGESRIAKRRLKKFIQSLTKEQRLAWETIMAQEPYSVSSDIDLLIRSLTSEQLELARPLLISSPPLPDISYPANRANRWIFRRVVALGWNPELFGVQDGYIARRDPGRSEHKLERWGKKYQWIAFHEYMARVADNYQTIPNYGQSPLEYEFNLRLDGLRDLDPSLPPVNYRDFVSRNKTTITWRESDLELPGRVALPISFDAYHGDIDRFISERRTEPLAHIIASRRDRNGQEWIALHSSEDQRESIGEESEWGLGQTVRLHSWFVSGEDADRQAAKLLREVQKDTWQFNTRSHERGTYWGELSWMNTPESWLTASWRVIGLDSAEPVNIIDTCEDYVWEGNDLDCSIENSAFAYVPSRYILNRTPLTPTDEGPAWKEPGGGAVFITTRGPHEEYPQSRPFWVRRDWIQAFLYREKLALVVAAWAERLSHLHVRTSQDKREVTLSVAVLTADGRLRKVGAPNRSPWPPDQESWVRDE